MENSLRKPIILGNKTYKDIENDILKPMEGKPSLSWILAFSVASMMFIYGGYCLYRTWWEGLGMWGENRTVNWAWDITNFVWWIGIGHAGTLISAILLLFRQKWRNSINRAAEAMTLAAVLCSVIYILSHMGRPWVSYWILPLPNVFGLWVNFNSALVWDTFAITTYFLVSLLFWYVGLIPDFGTIRDKSAGFKKDLFTILSFGWVGSARDWRRYERITYVLAVLATGLVISVHSIVSMDFATGIVPGWHSSIFPPYFVAGAIFSGFAMVITLLSITRKVVHLENYITIDHFEKMNKIILLTSGIVALAYGTEAFMTWYSGNPYDQYLAHYRLTGDYSWAYLLTLLFNIVLPQLLWFEKLRRNIPFSFVLSILINIGMWLERFVIIVASLSRDYLPSAWAVFSPTQYDIGVFIFTLGFFFMFFLLFAKFLPIINMSEVKSILKKNHE